MDDATRLQYLFQTLGDANRLRMIKFIGSQKRSVSEIVKETDLSQPLVSHHLRTLRERGILTTERNGPFIYYRLKNTKLPDALGVFLEIAGKLKGITVKNPMFCCPPRWRHF